MSSFVPGKTPIRLQEPSFGMDEMNEVVESLHSTMVVMGSKVRRFEDDWSRHLGVPHSLCVNSGTSAILLAMMWLKFHLAREGRDEVLIPAVTWSTTLFPAIVVGLRPVLVDVSLDNLCTNSFAPYINERTLAVVPVHLMGHAADVRAVCAEARGAGAVVLEDACEAHGTKLDGRPVGAWGDMSVFSFMFAHHMTTIEGGMLCAQSEEVADVFRMFRAHGWVRETSERFKSEVTRSFPDIHPSFLFADSGLNVRPTELVGAFGVHQLAKLPGFVDARRSAFFDIFRGLSEYEEDLILFPERPWIGEHLSPFAFPVVVRKGTSFRARDLMSFLEKKLIEVRPIEGSNLARQPFMGRYGHLVEVRGTLENADLVHDGGFFFGINQATDEARVSYILESFREFFRSLER